MKSKELKVGLLALSGIVLAYFGFNYLKGNGLFNKGNVFYSVYQDVEGLHIGSKVIINGFPVGRVKDLTIVSELNNKLLVKYVVMDEEMSIPENTVAEILAVDLFGSKAINLQIGNSVGLAASGDTLTAKEASGMLDSVQEKITPYENRFNNILADVDTVLSSVKITITSLNTLIENETGNIGKLSENAVSITQNLKENNDKITHTINNLSNMSDTLSQLDIKQILDNANKAVKDMSEAMEKINNGTGTMGKLMNDSSLYVNLNQSAIDLDILLKDLKENPKKYVHFSVWGGKDKEKDKSNK